MIVPLVSDLNYIVDFMDLTGSDNGFAVTETRKSCLDLHN